MDSRDHLDAVERARAQRELARAGRTVDHTVELEHSLADVLVIAARLNQRAREQFGLPRHGVSVNQAAADLYREFDEIDRAARNAVNALAVLTGRRGGEQLPTMERTTTP